MIKHLQLKNFKAWRDSGLVRLAPVTMLLGSNSSGKSTLLQSLLLLKQTAAAPDRSCAPLRTTSTPTSASLPCGRVNTFIARSPSPIM